jgi:hypothetical protein
MCKEEFMARRIRIEVGGQTVHATLSDNETADQIWDALPIETSVSTWGDEFYFGIGLSLDSSADARAEMEVGELGFWPPGNAFCIFFGPTPASIGDEPRAASAVNPFGMVEEDVSVLKGIPSGTKISIEAYES